MKGGNWLAGAVSLVLLFCVLPGCGGGGSSNGATFQPGPYAGSTVYRDPTGENVNNCLDYVEAALGDFYSLYVTEQFLSNNSSEIHIERELGSGILASVEPNADSADYSETVSASGFYGSGTVSCEGVRVAQIEPDTDRIISLSAELSLTCSVVDESGEQSAAVFSCQLTQEALLSEGF